MNGKMRAIGALLPLGLLLAACGGEEQPASTGDENLTGNEELTVAADTSSAYGSAAAAPVTPVQSGDNVDGPLTATGNLQPIAERFPPGSVTVTQADGGTRVLVKIDRYQPGTELAVSFVTGGCQEQGNVVHTVDKTMQVGTEGFATLDATAPVPTATLLDGRHSVRVHSPGSGPPQMVFACANLPAVTPNPGTAPVPNLP